MRVYKVAGICEILFSCHWYGHIEQPAATLYEWKNIGWCWFYIPKVAESSWKHTPTSLLDILDIISSIILIHSRRRPKPEKKNNPFITEIIRKLTDSATGGNIVTQLLAEIIMGSMPYENLSCKWWKVRQDCSTVQSGLAFYHLQSTELKMSCIYATCKYSDWQAWLTKQCRLNIRVLQHLNWVWVYTVCNSTSIF